METVRSWDWRTTPEEEVRAAADSAAAITAASSAQSPAMAPAAAEALEGSELPPPGSPWPNPGWADTQQVVLDPAPRHARVDPIDLPSLEDHEDASQDAAAWFRPVPPPDEDAPTDAASWFTQPSTEAQPKPEPGARPDAGPVAVRDQSPTRSRIRWAAVTVVAVAVVVLIIGGIRYLGTSPDPADQTTTTNQTTTTSNPSTSSDPATQISSTQLAQFQGFETGLQTANALATKGFDTKGTTPTNAELAAVAGSYRSALNVYDFQLHTIPWPASMQGGVQDESKHVLLLMSFLQTFSSVAPTGARAWLTYLHKETRATQSTDNQVRRDLGLPGTSSFP